MNVKRGINNIIYGVLSQIITMGISVIVPRLVLVNLGSESNGLLHSISTVFTYLTLLEAGVGKATNQALYKPLASNDIDAINRIMAATARFYRRTGCIYAVVVLLFAVLYCAYVNTALPKSVVFGVIVLSGAASVLSYFVQGKYRVLMGAEGKNYILTNIATVSSICTSICKILLLVYGFGVVEIQGMYLFFSVLQMLVILRYIRRDYRWLDLSVEPDYNAISQRNFVLLHQVTGMIFDNTDILLLTLMTDLKVVSVYSLYTTFYTVIKNTLNTFSFSYSYALGQVFHSDKEKFKSLHDVYEVYNMSLTFSFICILNIFILPFIRIYTSGITDVNYVDPYIPMLFTAVYLLSNGRASSGLVIDFAQHFQQTKWRAVLESCINILVSIIAIRFWGIYGALLGTIMALLYRANDMIIYANRLIGRSPWITYKRWLINMGLFAVVTLAANRILPEMESFIQIIVYGVVVGVIVVCIFLIVDSLSEVKTTSYALSLVKENLGSKKEQMRNVSSTKTDTRI